MTKAPLSLKINLMNDPFHFSYDVLVPDNMNLVRIDESARNSPNTPSGRLWIHLMTLIIKSSPQKVVHVAESTLYIEFKDKGAAFIHALNVNIVQNPSYQHHYAYFLTPMDKTAQPNYTAYVDIQKQKNFHKDFDQVTKSIGYSLIPH